MPDLPTLIAKLEAATGPSRELDAAIQNHLAGGSDRDLQYIIETGVDVAVSCPTYTGSIDAALSLVPEGWRLDKLAYGPRPQHQTRDAWSAAVWRDEPVAAAHAGFNSRAYPCTPALALAAAALRARLAMMETEDTG